MIDSRVAKLADVLVNYSLAVGDGELVRISGSPVAMPLVVELYARVLEAGGHPFVRMTPDELTELLLNRGSDQQIQFVNPISVYEVEHIDCSLGI